MQKINLNLLPRDLKRCKDQWKDAQLKRKELTSMTDQNNKELINKEQTWQGHIRRVLATSQPVWDPKFLFQINKLKTVK